MALNQVEARGIEEAERLGLAVDVRGLWRSFGTRTVLEDLDLEIRPGEFVALIGRSGGGKTTLLRTLGGLDPVQRGHVVVPEDRAIVFQEHRLLPWRSVWRNVAIGLAGDDVQGRARLALNEVGLGERADAWPLTLSGGEAQRAALARALVREPKLLLLDEPFGALDALTRLQMHELVLQLWNRHQPAVLLVTHDVDEALLLAQRILIIENGRLSAVELPPQEWPRRRVDPLFIESREIIFGRLGIATEAVVTSRSTEAVASTVGRTVESRPLAGVASSSAPR